MTNYKNKARMPPVSSGGATNTAAEKPVADDVIDPATIIPLGKSRKQEWEDRHDDGLNWLRNYDDMNFKNKNVIVTEQSVYVPEGSKEIWNVDEIKQMRNQRAIEWRERTSELESNGNSFLNDRYGPTPGGGLSVSGRGKHHDGDGDDGNSSSK